MKRFNVTVNGTIYDVVVEEVGTDDSAAPAPAAQKAATAAPKAAPAAPKTAPAAAPKATGKTGSVTVKAPMPGTIVKVNVNPGDKVTKGTVLCVLEAMKMENDICAPADGVVATVEAKKGATVATDDILVTLD